MNHPSLTPPGKSHLSPVPDDACLQLTEVEVLALTGKSSPWFRRAKKKSGVEPVGKIEGKTKPLKTYALFDIVRMCNETGWPVPTPVDVAALRAGPSSVPGVELVKAPGGGASGSADPSEMVSKADLDRRQANVEESERGLAAAREENGRVTLALSIATAQLDERTIRIASLEADVGGLRIEADGLRATNAHLGPENERLARELGRVASDLEHERTNAQRLQVDLSKATEKAVGLQDTVQRADEARARVEAERNQVHKRVEVLEANTTRSFRRREHKTVRQETGNPNWLERTLVRERDARAAREAEVDGGGVDPL